MKSDNRKNFPKCTAVIDALRAEFGNGIKVTYVEENGKSIGKKQYWIKRVYIGLSQ